MKFPLTDAVILFVAVGSVLVFKSAGEAQTLQRGNSDRPLQVTGDPPVTVSDGTLHAKSKRGWMADLPARQHRILTPKGTQLEVNALCGKMTGTDISGTTNPASAAFWADDHASWDISPAKAGGTTTVYIQFDTPPGGVHDSRIIITATDGGGMTIETKEDSFESVATDPRDRPHARKGEVEKIWITGSKHDIPQGTPWTPVNPLHTHFTLSFCYL
jgi:hypothetical protein